MISFLSFETNIKKSCGDWAATIFENRHDTSRAERAGRIAISQCCFDLKIMNTINYEIISHFYDNSSVVKFDFEKRKYCYIFSIESANEIANSDGVEIEARKFFDGEHTFIVMKNEHSITVEISENKGKDSRLYHVMAFLASDEFNSCFAMLVMDMHAETFARDLFRIKFGSNQNLPLSEALKLESIDVIYSSFF